MLTIDSAIRYRFAEPTDFLLQIEPAIIPEQRVEGWFACTPTEHFARVAAQDGIGERIALDAELHVVILRRSCWGRTTRRAAARLE